LKYLVQLHVFADHEHPIKLDSQARASSQSPHRVEHVLSWGSAFGAAFSGRRRAAEAAASKISKGNRRRFVNAFISFYLL